MNPVIGKLLRKNLLGWGCLLVMSSLIPACGGGGGSGGDQNSNSSSSTQIEPPPIVPKPVVLKPDTAPDPALPARGSPDWDKAVEASRFLSKATFGATAKDIDYIIKNGKSAWLEQQFAKPQTPQLTLFKKRLEDLGFVAVPPYMYNGGDSTREEFTFERVIFQHHIWMETSIWGEDQLRSRVAHALSQILVVSQFGANQFARETGFANYIDILAHGSFGNYGELLTDITLNPIMGLYLNTLNNPKADEAKFTRPDENYAREVMQLFSIGLYQLNNDGTLKLDANGKKIATYNQQTVKEFARVFTGWSYSTYTEFAQNGVFTIYPAAIANIDPMKAFQEYHDVGSKTLLNGEVIPAGQTARQDIDSAIRNIMNHPNVGPFISKQLIQYLITSNPSNAYVNRVATVFNDNGSGVKGDMKAVVKAIYMDDEANTPADQNSSYGKFKETPLAVSGIWRAFKAQGVPIKSPRTGTVTTIAHHHYGPEEQEMLHAPSVFNYYSSDYSPPGNLSKKKILAPETQIFDGLLAVHQNNLMANIIFRRAMNDKNIYTGEDAGEINGIIPYGDYWNPHVKALLNLTEERALAEKPEALVDRINLLLTQGKINAEDSALIVKHISSIADPLERIYEAIYIIAISPEYAVQG
ncbi:hypothetical protein GCM10011613_07100 [Cellvibrio zantedeschiae]|uniref:DUF1800 domain-containing protein n=1 Tax=Cellvibrio zantedeschiae TaxID=1237077 RepID=A0ABQ3ATH9_9GAMM|nr:DUF1800 family protein [Cellvibrio zantedeschiae]GGY65795.1 hypothetical protein GCM10011613_07100 [Cellvibrio zantedeschiae]